MPAISNSYTFAFFVFPLARPYEVNVYFDMLANQFFAKELPRFDRIRCLFRVSQPIWWWFVNTTLYFAAAEELT